MLGGLDHLIRSIVRERVYCLVAILRKHVKYKSHTSSGHCMTALHLFQFAFQARQRLNVCYCTDSRTWGLSDIQRCSERNASGRVTHAHFAQLVKCVGRQGENVISISTVLGGSLNTCWYRKKKDMADMAGICRCSHSLDGQAHTYMHRHSRRTKQKHTAEFWWRQKQDDRYRTHCDVLGYFYSALGWKTPMKAASKVGNVKR